MLKIFNTLQEYNTYTNNGQDLQSGNIYFVKEDNSTHFFTNNIDGTAKVYDSQATTPEPEPEPEQRPNGLTVYYNITNTDVENQLFNAGGGGSGSSDSGGGSSESGGGEAAVMPATMTVDGNAETPSATWRFTTTGEHVVTYTFTNNIIPAGFLYGLGITKVIIGDDITSIEDQNASTRGFCYHCTNLTEVKIGTGITYIGLDSFVDCSKLTSFTVYKTTPPELNSGALTGTNHNLIIYVPADSVETYKDEADWSEYSLQIQPIS